MVHLHGAATMTSRSRVRGAALQASLLTNSNTNMDPPPPNPLNLLSEDQLAEKVDMLLDWWHDKKQVLCITGAGLSTESGLADYRGHNGSYHRGHKPMIHDQFMGSEYQRKRYWGRGMVGWTNFFTAKPNKGHLALASLERNKKIGVTFDDQPEFYNSEQDDSWLFSSGQQQMAIITQNVDSLHRRAGSTHVTELHGRTDMLVCMSCGAKRERNDFHTELETSNREWLERAMNEAEMRPDGDAALPDDNNSYYKSLCIPPCQSCGEGFLKPSVVFFGDSVPSHRRARCSAAVDAADGLLVVGSSLAVYSSYRHVREAHQKGTPIAILNVGETRAELEQLNSVTKIEAPAGPTLQRIAQHFDTQNS
ncbi:lipoamidase sirtuin-4, mitochondrial [Seminavis robusta]|uniref:Lipoamidase sirtuin-4, mitochondrial n=1 Tax=Seminavis robusta TaxID=568900 RepID=A0A9N8E2F5_9STRA|nr:lipoamidase sirtuin-4, mitochondrial [Seminavis robusta]|eukprot:Sro488_g153130.1 lipoamidase sirtuin-4, mitochondrial (365) ;mRNA; f:39239-40333